MKYQNGLDVKQPKAGKNKAVKHVENLKSASVFCRKVPQKSLCLLRGISRRQTEFVKNLVHFLELHTCALVLKSSTKTTFFMNIAPKMKRGSGL